MKNMYIFIVWKNGEYKREKIIDDLSKSFHLIGTIELQWEAGLFAVNLSRFYGQKLTSSGEKESMCGVGPFTLVVVEDQSQSFTFKKTSRGVYERVNPTVFQKKQLYRSWTDDGSSTKNDVHCSNTPEESEHDVALLLDHSPEEIVKLLKQEKHICLQKNIVGYPEWESWKKLIKILNLTLRYAFTKISENNKMIEILTLNFEDLIGVLNGSKVSGALWNNTYSVNIAGQEIIFQIYDLHESSLGRRWLRQCLFRKQRQGSEPTVLTEKERALFQKYQKNCASSATEMKKRFRSNAGFLMALRPVPDWNSFCAAILTATFRMKRFIRKVLIP